MPAIKRSSQWALVAKMIPAGISSPFRTQSPLHR